MNLLEGLLEEMNRNRELLVTYQEAGPNGAYGAWMIEADIESAEKAIGDGDIVAEMRCYTKLKENK